MSSVFDRVFWIFFVSGLSWSASNSISTSFEHGFSGFLISLIPLIIGLVICRVIDSKMLGSKSEK